jgi:hypothetical protein
MPDKYLVERKVIYHPRPRTVCIEKSRCIEKAPSGFLEFVGTVTVIALIGAALDAASKK